MFTFQAEMSGHACPMFVRVRGFRTCPCPNPCGSPVLHPGALHFFMALHPERKMHYILNDTSSNMPLHLLVHFIPNSTSSLSHFISPVISSHMLLHPIRHFISPVNSSHTSLQPVTHESFHPASPAKTVKY